MGKERVNMMTRSAIQSARHLLSPWRLRTRTGAVASDLYCLVPWVGCVPGSGLNCILGAGLGFVPGSGLGCVPSAGLGCVPGAGLDCLPDFGLGWCYWQ